MSALYSPCSLPVELLVVKSSLNLGDLMRLLSSTSQVHWLNGGPRLENQEMSRMEELNEQFPGIVGYRWTWFIHVYVPYASITPSIS